MFAASLRYIPVLAGALLLVQALPASVIIDPPGDFLPSYTDGPLNGDLDVLQAEVIYDGTDFVFTSTSAANIGTTKGGVFVWGINRGAGFATFPIIAPGVKFDVVFVIAPDGNSIVTDLASNVTTPIPSSAVSFSGADLSGRISASLLPSLGFAPEAYTVNLWPRSKLAFVDEVVSDFAPNNSNAAVTVIPEPTSLALVSLAVGVLLVHRRKRLS